MRELDHADLLFLLFEGGFTMKIWTNWMLSVTASALLLGFLSQMDDGKQKKLLQFVGNLLVLLTVIAPLAKLDPDWIAQSISKLQIQSEEIRTGVAVTNRDLQARIIKEKSEAYILDKAGELGVTITPDISLRDDAGYPYPYRIVVEGTITEKEKRMLSKILAEDLGIPEQRQEWKTP